MAIISGCQEGKATPKLAEVRCPKCGEEMEVFVYMGGSIQQTGRVVSDETCTCGHIIPSGTAFAELEEVL